jgi:maltose operon protein
MPLRTAREFHEAAPIAAYQGFADFPFEKLSLKDNRLFLIDEHSPAFNFATGKSFFRAFALPQSSTPYTVTLRSYLVGPTLKNGYIFAPRAIFLDDSFTVTRTLGTDDFHYANPGFFENMGGKGLSWRAMLEGSTRIDRSARDEHYLIILTTKKALEEKTIMPEPVYAMDWDWLGTPWALRRTGEVKIPVSNSPVGNLRIILE